MEKQPNNIWDIFHLLHNIQQILAYLHKKKEENCSLLRLVTKMKQQAMK